MVTGTRFKLNERILGIEVVDGNRNALSIPVGAVIEMVPDASRRNQTVDVLWGHRKLEIFACDLRMRGTEMIGPQT